MLRHSLNRQYVRLTHKVTSIAAWSIQVGSFANEKAARDAAVPARQAADGGEVRIEPDQPARPDRIWRAQVIGLTAPRRRVPARPGAAQPPASCCGRTSGRSRAGSEAVSLRQNQPDPMSSATSAMLAMPMNRPVSTTPIVWPIGLIQAGRIGDRTEAQSRIRLPPSVRNGCPSGPAAAPARCQAGQPGCRRLPAERHDLDRHRCRSAQPSISFGSSATITSRSLAAATIFSRSRAPPRPLIRLSEPVSISSAPSIVRSNRRCSAKLVSGMPPVARLRRAALGGGDGEGCADLRAPAGSAPRWQRGGRAGAETDHHAVLDQCQPRPPPPSRFCASRSINARTARNTRPIAGANT